MRYVSKFEATGDKDQLARLVNTTLFTYSCLGLFLLLLTILGTSYVDRLLAIAPVFLRDARILFLMVGTSLALGFPLGISGGILEGLQRFYLMNWTNIVSTLMRAVLIIFALKRGFGLLTVALITVSLPLIMSALRGVIAQRLLAIQYGWKYVDRASLRQVANYGGVTFIIIVAGRLRFKSDAVVIGTFLSATAITYFYIGARLVDYGAEVVNSLAQIFTPMSSQFHAIGDHERLRKIFIAGNRACAFVMFPISVSLVVMGKSVIEAWMGPRYISSYTVLLIILIPTTLYYAQTGSNRILFGTSQHKALAYIALIEGIANVISEYSVGKAIRNCGRCHRHCDSPDMHIADVSAASHVSPARSSNQEIYYGNLLLSCRPLRPHGPHTPCHAAVLVCASLSTAHCQSAGRLGSLRARGALVCAHA